MSSFITNRDIPIFVTIPVIFLASKKNSVQNGKMGAKNSVAKELILQIKDTGITLCY